MTDSQHDNSSLSLGKEISTYPKTYEPKLLYTIQRATARQSLHCKTPYPFIGVDIWNAYELSWLNPMGKPQVALLTLYIPCNSPYLIESKSLKLYLNSLNQTHFESVDAVRRCIRNDISQAVHAAVSLNISEIDRAYFSHQLLGVCLDAREISCSDDQPNPDLLKIISSDKINETVYSHLFRSNCPVTGQPDWASIWIDYTGPRLCHDALLQYLVSYRNHNGFHEHCIEQIFCDLIDRCESQKLSIMAYFTRRGGIDINPYRSNIAQNPKQNHRMFRQ